MAYECGMDQGLAVRTSNGAGQLDIKSAYGTVLALLLLLGRNRLIVC